MMCGMIVMPAVLHIESRPLCIQRNFPGLWCVLARSCILSIALVASLPSPISTISSAATELRSLYATK